MSGKKGGGHGQKILVQAGTDSPAIRRGWPVPRIEGIAYGESRHHVEGKRVEKREVTGDKHR